jgi:hypothetical protein
VGLGEALDVQHVRSFLCSAGFGRRRSLMSTSWL